MPHDPKCSGCPTCSDLALAILRNPSNPALRDSMAHHDLRVLAEDALGKIKFRVACPPRAASTPKTKEWWMKNWKTELLPAASSPVTTTLTDDRKTFKEWEAHYREELGIGRPNGTRTNDGAITTKGAYAFIDARPSYGETYDGEPLDGYAIALKSMESLKTK